MRTITLAGAPETPAVSVSTPPAPAGLDPSVRFFRIFAVSLAIIQYWHARHAMTTDGVSYLDTGQAFFRGDWHIALNGVWSPLYSLLLGLAAVAVRPSPGYVFLLAHVVTFLTFVAALAAFEVLLRAIIDWLNADGRRPRRRTWTALGYSLFIWASLGITSVGAIAPDLLTSAFVYLAAALVLKLQLAPQRSRDWLRLGVVLGIGFWVRAPFLFWAPAFALAALARKGPLPWKGFRLAAAAFAFAVLPLALSLSLQKGRPALTDSGWLNYAWYVNGVTYRHWQGEPAGAGERAAGTNVTAPQTHGRPSHSTRKLLETPPVYGFNRMAGCTYPVWCNPSYWYEGVRVRLQLEQQVRALWRNTVALLLEVVLRAGVSRSLGAIGVVSIAGLAVGLLLHRRATGAWTLIALGCAGIAPYLLVHLEGRYVAAHLCLLLLGGFSFVRLPADVHRWIALLLVAVALPQHLLLMADSTAERPKELPVAQAARQAGMSPGDALAALNYANIWHTRWAKLAGLRLVAEIHTSAFDTSEDSFWHAQPHARRRVEDAFRVAGARYAVARFAPVWAEGEGWRRLGDTGYSYLDLENAKGGSIPPGTAPHGRR